MPNAARTTTPPTTPPTTGPVTLLEDVGVGADAVGAEAAVAKTPCPELVDVTTVCAEPAVDDGAGAPGAVVPLAVKGLSVIDP